MRRAFPRRVAPGPRADDAAGGGAGVGGVVRPREPRLRQIPQARRTDALGAIETLPGHLRFERSFM
jgi:hypothetical protein